MIDHQDRLRYGAERILGGTLTAKQETAFGIYLDLLGSWNRVHRLVGSSDRRWMVENVILDSLMFLHVMPASWQTLLDIGSGAGIPGIPIWIVRPGSAMVMAESRRKRASFLAAAVRAIDLRSARVVNGRAETLVNEGLRFDVVVARCAGSVRSILEIGVRLATESGIVIVAGAPGASDIPGAEEVRVVSPETGAPRTFIVRRGGQ